jgi:hypothetical protein
MRTNKRGIELLLDPSLNKSTAFTEAEKQALGIVGLVPDVTETEDLQLSRVMMKIWSQDHRPRTLHLPDQSPRPQRDALLSDGHVRSGPLSADRL